MAQNRIFPTAFTKTSPVYNFLKILGSNSRSQTEIVRHEFYIAFYLLRKIFLKILKKNLNNLFTTDTAESTCSAMSSNLCSSDYVPCHRLRICNVQIFHLRLTTILQNPVSDFRLLFGRAINLCTRAVFIISLWLYVTAYSLQP